MSKGGTMTENKWQKGRSPKPLLAFICLKTTTQSMNRSPDRKLRLFACACVRRLALNLKDDRLWKIVSAVERAADTDNSEELLKACHEEMATVDPLGSLDDDLSWPSCRDAVRTLTLPKAKSAAKLAAEKAKLASGCDAWFSVQPEGQTKTYAGESSDPKIKPLAAALDRAWVIERDAQARLLRDIFGPLPFRPIAIDPRWLTSTVIDLAAAIYEEKAFGRLGILADALMDSGCDSEEIIAHCRGDGPHVRGCWVVDKILGKE